MNCGASVKSEVIQENEGNTSYPCTPEDNEDEVLTPQLQEQYIELMCQICPNRVYSYLKNSEGYRIESVLEVRL